MEQDKEEFVETAPQPRGSGIREDFSQLFEESLRSVKPGEIVRGRVVKIGPEFVTVDIGYKSEGHIPLAEFRLRDGRIAVHEGEEIDVYFDAADSEQEGIVLSRAKAQQFRVWREIEEAYLHKSAIEGAIVGKVKGGLKVDIGVTAFLPGSHVDIRPVRDLDRFIGKRGKFAVLKYDPERERVSLGLKQLIPDPWATVTEHYSVGSRVRGKVVSLADYGAFIELAKGVEGLLHVSEMSWTKRVVHPSKLLSVGEEVEVVILDIDPGHRRISLGLKQVGPNPWELVRLNHPVGSRIHGKIKSITDFGVFMEVEDGIDGLVHISDLHWTKKVKHPSELYKKGDEVDAVVLGVDVENERVSLGIKQAMANPWTTVQGFAM